MLGIIFSVVAGVFMSLQGVFNTKLTEKIGIWETNVLVQGIGFALTLLILLFIGSGNMRNLRETNKLYLLGGVFGVFIIFSVIKGISLLGTTCAISIILVAQLTSAALIDAFGLFGTEQIKFGITKYIGVIVMAIGILIFKWKC